MRPAPSPTAGPFRSTAPTSSTSAGSPPAPAPPAPGRTLQVGGPDIPGGGGESPPPGAPRPLAEEELDRVIPVITALAETGATVSVDTMRHQVAAQALEAGATIVNDVSGGLADP